MTKSISTEFNVIQFGKLTDYMTKEFYEVAYIKGKQAVGKVNFLKTVVSSVEGLELLQQYDLLVNDIQKFNTQRLVYFTPYLKELAEKNDEGHNCTACSGKCDMHHTARLLDFTLSLDEVRRALQKNNELFNMEYDDTYAELKQLHMDVYLLSNILDRLFEIEETTLLPKIKEAQKKINVTS